MLLTILAQDPGVASGNGDIVTIVYVLTSISLIIGFIIGTYKYIQRQKNKWTNEGIVRQQQAQATADNTTQMNLNTEAVGLLTTKFTEFALSVRQEMDEIGGRLGSLEQWRAGSNGGNR
jgi:uncharacterized protein HemX